MTVTTSTPAPGGPSYHIGVLLLNGAVQLLDLSPIDLFGMCTPSYISACPLPPPLQALAHKGIKISYISSAGPDALTECTSSLGIRVTDSLTSAAVAPGQLDVLMIPGPEPGYIPTEAEKKFIRDHTAAPREVILSVCTGIFGAGYAGILDGRVATGPRGLLGDLKTKFPKVKWVEKRWAVTEDGKLWTSAGITNGQDMVAAYLHSQHARAKGVSTELADLVCAIAEVGHRGEEYGNSSAGEGAWWFWLIIRSWWRGGSKRKG